MSCPFYGFNGMAAGILVSTDGNQCALIIHKHAPCYMEQDGQDPDIKTCALVRVVRHQAEMIAQHLPEEVKANDL